MQACALLPQPLLCTAKAVAPILSPSSNWRVQVEKPLTALPSYLAVTIIVIAMFELLPRDLHAVQDEDFGLDGVIRYGAWLHEENPSHTEPCLLA